MEITNAKYVNCNYTNQLDNIIATIDGVTMSIPINESSFRYREIMRQVEAGELTIADAE